MQLSQLAENIIGSEIIKLAADINEKIKQGQSIYNYTIGDFDPKLFPIPEELKNAIITEYQSNQTNYPPSEGVLDLRIAVKNLLSMRCNLQYNETEILIAGGARPIIYSIYRAIVNPGDEVIFATPSWNNNHYTYLNGGKPVIIETEAKNNFMPTVEDIKPHIQTASLLALCSPQNPTGTMFKENNLREICNMVVEENLRRGENQKPVYLLYDQIYWELTFGTNKHYNPVTLNPEIRNYTVFIDGISKSLSATGVRVGWCMGPQFIINKMKSILSHIGAWAPKAEQIATANYLSQINAYSQFIETQKEKISQRLFAFYNGFKNLEQEGFAIDVIEPQAAIYLTVQFKLIGKKTKEGKLISNSQDITEFLINDAQLAIVPFSAFGSSPNSSWFRLSVGTTKIDDIPKVLEKVKMALRTVY